VWNHNVIDKSILHQSYWSDYKDLYEVLAACTEVVPGYRRAGKEFLNASMRKAYRNMDRWERTHASSRQQFLKTGRMEDEMAMQPMMQPEPQKQRTSVVQLEQLIDEIRASASALDR
jgi:hypothetical protein